MNRIIRAIRIGAGPALALASCWTDSTLGLFILLCLAVAYLSWAVLTDRVPGAGGSRDRS